MVLLFKKGEQTRKRKDPEFLSPLSSPHEMTSVQPLNTMKIMASRPMAREVAVRTPGLARCIECWPGNDQRARPSLRTEVPIYGRAAL